MPQEQCFHNARIVLNNEIITGSMKIVNGKIEAIDQGNATIGEDCNGDYLIPGLVELHTDNVEVHLHPRPKVRWNTMTALQAHDMQICGSGITTVFDGLRVGHEELRGYIDSSTNDLLELADSLSYAQQNGLLKAEHFIHLRCEVSLPNTVKIFDQIANNAQVKLVSLMDHAPGQRQFASIEAYKIYYQGKYKMPDAEFMDYAQRRIEQSAQYAHGNRQTIARQALHKGIALASHDDATIDHVSEGINLGVVVSEFPTTLDAAVHAHENGLHVLMGAPNIVRGKSHSGNISASSLLQQGCLDILSSDYVPFSLLQAVFCIADHDDKQLPDAVRLVALNPAQAAGFNDRGELTIGKRADIVRIKTHNHIPYVKGVWREGNRIA